MGDFGTIGSTGERAFMLSCKWKLVVDGVVIGYATEPGHFSRTLEVMGGGSVVPVEPSDIKGRGGDGKG